MYLYKVEYNYRCHLRKKNWPTYSAWVQLFKLYHHIIIAYLGYIPLTLTSWIGSKPVGLVSQWNDWFGWLGWLESIEYAECWISSKFSKIFKKMKKVHLRSRKKIARFVSDNSNFLTNCLHVKVHPAIVCQFH